MTLRLAPFLTGFVILAPAMQGQIVRGTVRESESGRAIESGVITLLDANGTPIRAVLTDSMGHFGLRAPASGAYRLRFERLGFRPLTIDRFTLDEGENETKDLRPTAVSVSLERIIVTDRPRCRVLPDADTVTARVWTAVRGVLASAVAGETGWYPHVTVERYERDHDSRRKLVTRERKWTQTGASTAPFVALPAPELEKRGFVVRDRDSVSFYAPDARTLIAEEFLRTHCFRVRDDRTQRGRLGLEIEPVPGRVLPEIKGTLWIDAASGELRRLDFVYINLPANVPRNDAGGWVEFRQLPRGGWVVDSWLLRLPLVGPPPPASVYGSGVTVAGELPAGRVTELLGTHEKGGRIVSLGGERSRAAGQSVTVAVQGSVTTADGAPVPAARAFLSGTSHSSVTDREGRFAMLDVPPGRYRLSFTHPRLDTLGIIGPVLELHVRTAAEHQLTMPTDDQIAQSACRPASGESGREPPMLLYGYVRERSSSAVVPEATVTVTWRASLARGPTGGVRKEALEVRSDATGYYQVCGIPRDTPLTLRATKGPQRGPDHPVEALASAVTRLDVELGGRSP